MANDYSKDNVAQAGAWAVILCAPAKTFLFGKRSSAVNKGGTWNFFGGRVDRGELPRAALVRELAEETGLLVRSGELIELDWLSRGARGVTGAGLLLRDMHYYLLRLDSELVPRLNHEHSDFGWFKGDKLPGKFNKPTALAIKKGVLGKATDVALRSR